VARADEEGKWKFVGMLPLFDPPRADAKETIANAIQMGVKIKMVTGDQIAIARETSKELGLGVQHPGRQRAWRYKEEGVAAGLSNRKG
jgi:H+-transporting ATPase